MAYLGAGLTRFNTADELTVTGDAQIDTNTLVVDSTNNRVGILTASPATALDVTGTVTSDGLTVDNNGSLIFNDPQATDTILIGTNDNELIIRTDDGDIALKTNENKQALRVSNNGDINFYEDTGTTAKLFWDASSEVLQLGTTSAPVNAATNFFINSAVPMIEMEDSDTNAYARMYVSGSSFYLDADHSEAGASTTLNLRVDDETALTIDSSQNVGIGNSSPSNYYSDRLVVGVGDEDGITIAGSSGHHHYIMFADGTSGNERYRGYIGYDHADDHMKLATSGAERIRIDASGNIGINTTVASATLHIQDIGSTNPALLIAGGSGSEGDITVPHDEILQIGHWNITSETFTERMRMNTSGDFGIGTSSPTEILHINDQTAIIKLECSDASLTSDQVLGGLQWRSNDPSGIGVADVGQVMLRSDSSVGGSYYMQFNVSSSSSANFEAMRISNRGQLRIGTTSSLTTDTEKAALQVKGGGGGPHVVYIRNNDTSGGANQIEFQDGSGDNCGEINSNATSNTTTYGTSSDHRLKENVTDVTGAIDTVKLLQPRTYNFISDPDDTPQNGFIAHELAAIVPNAVTGEKDAVKEDGSIKPQQVDYGLVTPILTAALKEAIAKIETLETKVAALEAN